MTKSMLLTAGAMASAVVMSTAAHAAGSPEAEIVGGETYLTLADAYAAAKTGDTIKLLCDCKLTQPLTNTVALTVDFNGKTVDGTDLSSRAFACVTPVSLVLSNGTFTATTTSCKGFGYFAGSDPADYGTGASVTLDGLTIYDEGSSSGICVELGATCMVRNCNISGKRTNAGLFVGDSSVLTVEDSKVEIDNVARIESDSERHYQANAIGVGGRAAKFPQYRGKLYVRGNSTVRGGMYGIYMYSYGGLAQLEGGTYGYCCETNFTTGTNPSVLRKSACVFADHVNGGNSKYPGSGGYHKGSTNIVQIIGGTFNGRIAQADGYCGTYISGGTFNNYEVHQAYGNNATPDGDFQISGGSFDADPNEFVIEGKIAKKTTDRWDNFVNAVRFTVTPGANSAFVGWTNDGVSSTNVADFAAKQYLRKIAIGDDYAVTFAANDGYEFDGGSLTNIVSDTAEDVNFEVVGPDAVASIVPVTPGQDMPEYSSQAAADAAKAKAVVQRPNVAVEAVIGAEDYNALFVVKVVQKSETSWTIAPEFADTVKTVEQQKADDAQAAIAATAATAPSATVVTQAGLYYGIAGATEVGSVPGAQVLGWVLGDGTEKPVSVDKIGTTQGFYQMRISALPANLD